MTTLIREFWHTYMRIHETETCTQRFCSPFLFLLGTDRIQCGTLVTVLGQLKV